MSKLGTFLSKFDDWRFCPPSNNLWTVSFLLAPRKGNNITSSSFSELYRNIITVNKQYSNYYSPLWNLKTPKEVDEYIISSQDPNIGFFLANNISFNNNSASIQESASQTIQNHTGWISFGKIQQGRDQNHAASIRFYKTNWDINELFFDRWISAIGQQGLIEDSTLSNIKANIIIREYAAGAPDNKGTTWIPRKQITLIRAFPKSRDQNNYTYDFDKAGVLEDVKVDFEFDAYQIEYFSLPNYKKQEGKSKSNNSKK